jgi:hypothetical protein
MDTISLFPPGGSLPLEEGDFHKVNTMFSMIDLLFSESYINRTTWRCAGNDRIARHCRLIWEEMERKGLKNLYRYNFSLFKENSVHWQIMENDNLLYNQKWSEKYQSNRVKSDWSSDICKLIDLAMEYQEDLELELNGKYQPYVPSADDDEF